MPPRLIAVAGPLTGTSLPLTRIETSIGSDRTNHVGLADRLVSPRHCLMLCRDRLVTIHDLDHTNTSFVNGLPAGERALVDGDEIQIGSSLFILQLADAAENPATALDTVIAGDVASDPSEAREDSEPSSTTVVMHREDVFGDAPFHRMATAERLSRDLSALIRASTAINAVRGLVALERPLLA